MILLVTVVVVHCGGVKDLRRLGRELNQVVIIDNSPMSYMFQPENAVSCCFTESHFSHTNSNDFRYLQRVHVIT